jgi:hypothetical protein
MHDFRLLFSGLSEDFLSVIYTIFMAVSPKKPSVSANDKMKENAEEKM